MPTLSNGFRILQSSYAKGINIQRQRNGNLFQQKTKSKLVSEEFNYCLTAFDYIHLNPKVAGLVEYLEDWPYSSFRDYAGLRNGTLCNKQLAISLLGLSDFNFKLGDKNLDNDDLKKLL